MNFPEELRLRDLTAPIITKFLRRGLFGMPLVQEKQRLTV
jgi:hypothetical protein